MVGGAMENLHKRSTQWLVTDADSMYTREKGMVNQRETRKMADGEEWNEGATQGRKASTSPTQRECMGISIQQATESESEESWAKKTRSGHATKFTANRPYMGEEWPRNRATVVGSRGRAASSTSRTEKKVRGPAAGASSSLSLFFSFLSFSY